MFGKNKKDKWFKTTHKLYCKRKLAAPYHMLFRYYLEVCRSSPLRVYAHGNFEYFSMLKFDGITDGAVEELRAVLPENLLENYLAAFAAYKELGEEPEVDDIWAAMSGYDDYADEHSEEMAEILRNYVNEMTEKHAF